MTNTLVLCYHALSERWPADLSVRPDTFVEQLELLRRRGYRGVTFSEAVLQSAPFKRVAVTFDDGYSSVARVGRPILDGLGWPGTVFTVSGFAANGQPLRWPGIDRWEGGEHADELAGMDWTALRELADAGWEIGSHTVSHPRLTEADDETLDRELGESRSAVEGALGSPCRSIAYPYGDVDARVREAAARAGYVTGGGLPHRWPARHPLEYPRVGVYHQDGIRRFRAKVSPVTRRVRRIIRR